eukprot:1609061-Amphidinium_carterae.1
MAFTREHILRLVLARQLKVASRERDCFDSCAGCCGPPSHPHHYSRCLHMTCKKTTMPQLVHSSDHLQTQLSLTSVKCTDVRHGARHAQTVSEVSKAPTETLTQSLCDSVTFAAATGGCFGRGHRGSAHHSSSNACTRAHTQWHCEWRLKFHSAQR